MTAFRMDTGADVTVVNLDTAEKLKLQKVTELRNLVDAEGMRMDNEGIARRLMKCKGRETMANLYVVRRATQNLIRVPEVEKLALMRRANKVAVEEKFSALYKKLGRLPETFRIIMYKGA